MLGAHVTQLHGNSNQGFKAEYEVRQLYLVSLNVINAIMQSFYNGEGMSTAVGRTANNKHKNRFANIVTCEYSTY